MIRVKCDPERCIVTVEGHSGSAPKGEDLVCAACSIVTLTLAELVLTVCDDREVELREGFAKIRGTMRAADYFDFAMAAYRALASEYPEYVALTEK